MFLPLHRKQVKLNSFQQSFQLDCGAFYVCPKVGGKVHWESNNGATEFSFAREIGGFHWEDVLVPVPVALKGSIAQAWI